MPSNDQHAVALYTIAARDVCDFIDMIREPETTKETLVLLQEMLAAPGTEKTDRKLNALILPLVEQEIANRG